MATNGWVSNQALRDDCVDTSEIADGALSADTAGRAKMATYFLQNSHIPDGTITLAKLSSSKVLYSGIYGLSEYGRSVYA